LIARVTLSPGDKRGEIRATLHGDLATIVDWTERGNQKHKTDIQQSGMSVSVVAGVRNHLDLLLSTAIFASRSPAPRTTAIAPFAAT